jgi:hypothetical protein
MPSFSVSDFQSSSSGSSNFYSYPPAFLRQYITKMWMTEDILQLTIVIYCILASCYIRLTLNICSFVRQCNTLCVTRSTYPNFFPVMAVYVICFAIPCLAMARSPVQKVLPTVYKYASESMEMGGLGIALSVFSQKRTVRFCN